MAGQDEFLRFASPNERRSVIREDLGFYHAVVVGAVYEFRVGFRGDSAESFFLPLKKCIESHPFLGVTVGDAGTEKPFFQRVSTINVADHISIQQATGDDHSLAIQETLRSALDAPFRQGIPSWKIIVVPLCSSSHCFVALSFSHTIGDGPSGKAFHRTFLRALRQTAGNAASSLSQTLVVVPKTPLPAPFDTPERLPISWSFLLAPLISTMVPHFITNLLGLRSGAIEVNAGTWTGTEMFWDGISAHTKVRVREVPASNVRKAVQAARAHDAKLTAVIQQLVVRALDKLISDPNVTNFISQTAISMRGAVGVSDDEFSTNVSGLYLHHPRCGDDGCLSKSLTDKEWAAATLNTNNLAMVAATLQDQAIGLLRYVTSIRKWLLGKMGQRRDASFEVSNIGTFETDDNGTDSVSGPRITKVVFAQPGHVTSVPLCLNFASAQGGSMVYTVTWPTGSLGNAVGDEEEFVERLCSLVDAGFEALI